MTKKLFAIALAFLSSISFAAAPSVSTGALGYPKTAAGTDASDLWWIPSESGWGMQLVQESNFIFATLFIYGPDGKPTWATAQLTAVGPYVYSGPLYLTTGPWFGGPFDPNAVGVRQAGSMTFTLQFVERGSVTYSIDGVQVTKQVQRQTLVLDNYTGNYAIEGNFQATGCFNPNNDLVATNAFAVTVSQSGPNMSMIWIFPNRNVCTFSGVYSQAGHMGEFDGSYTCTIGDVGQMRFFELSNRPGIINGRLISNSSNQGCQTTGYFSGIDPNNPPQ